jgi:hypothetical protein
MRGEAGRNQPRANRPLTEVSLANGPLTNWSLAKLPLAKLLNNNVGQVVNLRPIVNRPTAAPAKLFRRSRQPRRHRIHRNVISDSLKLRLVANQPIVALILPERMPGQSKHLIAFASCESLKRLHHLGNLNQGSHQEMNVIRHHNVGVELVMPQLPKANGVHYHSGDLGDAKVERASACAVENAVHCEEGPARSGRGREVAICRQTSVQAPRDEDGLADGMVVRKTAASKSSHLETVARWGKILRKVERPIANRPQVTNLPHNAASSHSSQQPAAQQAAGTVASSQRASGTAASRHSSQPGGTAASQQYRQRQWSLRVNAA